MGTRRGHEEEEERRVRKRVKGVEREDAEVT